MKSMKLGRPRQLSFPPPTLNTPLPLQIEEHDEEEEEEESKKSLESFEIIK